MKVSGVAFCLVAFVLVLPTTTAAGAGYLALVGRLWPWLLAAAAGWMLGIVYVLRRVLELLLKRPGARTQMQRGRA
jgi:hypothetical protein